MKGVGEQEVVGGWLGGGAVDVLSRGCWGLRREVQADMEGPDVLLLIIKKLRTCARGALRVPQPAAGTGIRVRDKVSERACKP